jgi:hypothetical protein
MSNGCAKAMHKDIYSFLCCFYLVPGAGPARRAVDAVSSFYNLEKNGSVKTMGIGYKPWKMFRKPIDHRASAGTESQWLRVGSACSVCRFVKG